MSATEKNQDQFRYPTLTQIAKRCGVSQSTVSRALNNVKGRQSDETRQRIQAVASEMGYDPMRFQAARQLLSVKFGKPTLNHILGFSFYRQGFAKSNYFVHLLQGVLAAVDAKDFEVLTLPEMNESSVTGGQLIPSSFRRGEVDGLLVITEQEFGLDCLRQHPGFGSRPVVGLVMHLDGCSGVFPDNISGGYQALSHLLTLGHRRILMLHDYLDIPRATVYRQRIIGFEKASSEFGLDPRALLVPHLWSPEDTDKSIAQLIKAVTQEPYPTAVIANNDQQAVALYRALRSVGINIPSDISLISYDDTDSIMDSRGNNVLTSVRLPLVEIGSEGVELLVRRVLGEETTDRDIVLPVELIERASTAQPRQTIRLALSE